MECQPRVWFTLFGWSCFFFQVRLSQQNTHTKKQVPSSGEAISLELWEAKIPSLIFPQVLRVDPWGGKKMVTYLTLLGQAG